jgi:hypothetical protein
MRVIAPPAGCFTVPDAHQVDLVPHGRVGQEMAQAGPLARAVRQPHRQHLIAARQPGEHHRQRTAVIPPRPRRRPRRSGHAGGLGQDRGPGRAGGRHHRSTHRRGQLRVPVGLEVSIQGADQPVGFPDRRGLGVRAGPPRNAGEIPPRADPRRAVPAPRGVGEQMPIHRLPHLIGQMQPDRLGQVITHPPAGLDMRPGRRLDPLARQPQPGPQTPRIGAAFMAGSPIRPAPRRRVALQRPPKPKRRTPLPLHAPAQPLIGDVELQADHRHRTAVGEIRRLRPTPPPRHHIVAAGNGRGVGGLGCHSDHETITDRHRPAPAPIPKPGAAHRADRRSRRHHLRTDPAAAAAARDGPGPYHCPRGCCWC